MYCTSVGFNKLMLCLACSRSCFLPLPASGGRGNKAGVRTKVGEYLDLCHFCFPPWNRLLLDVDASSYKWAEVRIFLLQCLLVLLRNFSKRVLRTGESSNLVDSASSHTLVSKTKPCTSKYKYFTLKLRMAHYISYSLFDSPLLFG